MSQNFEDFIVITNRALVKGDFFAQLEKILTLRPHALILREKDLSPEAYLLLAQQVMDLCKNTSVECFLQTNLQIAMQLKCGNIHLSVPMLQEAASQLALLRKNFDEISIACHSLQDVKMAKQYGATQIILGTIFETECKKGMKGKGLSFVQEICERTSLPVYAVGGIKPEHIQLLKLAGAAGGCMMSGFMRM